MSIYRLNLLIDVTQDVCRKGRFLPDSGNADPLLRSRCWLIRQDPNQNWAFSKTDDQPLSITPLDSIMISIGHATNIQVPVLADVVAIVARDRQNDNSDGATSPFLLNSGSSNPNARSVVFWSVQNNTQYSEHAGFRYYDLSLPAVAPSSRGNGVRRFRLQVGGALHPSRVGETDETQYGHQLRFEVRPESHS